MKFELSEYKKQLSDDEILDDISNVAKKLNVDYISISSYKKHGKFSQTAIQGHFGTWKKALQLAGLRTERTSSELKLISDEVYFEDLRKVAVLIESDTVPYEAYRQYGKFSAENIFKRFGKWNTALELAGLTGTGFSKDRITEQQCFDEIERLWTLLGRQPTSTDITKSKISKYSLDTYKRRFGSWRKALEAFVKYINDEDILNSNKSEIADDFFDECSFSHIEDDEELHNTTVESSSVPKHRTSRNVNLRLRFKVMQRDNFKCCFCGASPATNPTIKLHIDHILPWAKGGETTLDNLQTLCSDCNLGKSDL